MKKRRKAIGGVVGVVTLLVALVVVSPTPRPVPYGSVVAKRHMGDTYQMELRSAKGQEDWLNVTPTTYQLFHRGDQYGALVP